MTESLEQLIAALRQELQQYGEMLALLDTQQPLIVKRAAAELLQTVANVNAQTAVIAVARREREAAQRVVAQEMELPQTAALGDVIRATPEPQASLIQTLLHENNTCLLRIRKRAFQNRLLLSRSIEWMQRLMSSLLVEPQMSVYTGTGSVTIPPTKTAALCNAVG